MKYTAALFVITLFGTVYCGYEPQGNNDGYGGLRNIAQGSANQAHSAVANQHAAAQKASFIVKNSLAQQASQAAGTAQAALAGKHDLLQTLEKQRENAHRALEGELAQSESAKQAAGSAASTAEQAAKHVKILQEVLHNTEALAQQATSGAAHTATELASQSAMVALAKAKLQEIEHRLEATRLDFEATKEASQKAADFAQKAHNNAAAAAAAAHSGSGLSGSYGQEGGQSGRNYYH